MIDAMVSDTSSHLEQIQSKRDELEALIAEGKDECESITLCVQSLSKFLKDYKTCAGHVKKHIAKPKAKAKEQDVPPSSGAPSAAETPAASG